MFDFLYDNDEPFKLIGGIITFVSGLVLLIMLIIIPCVYIGIDAKVEQSKEIYKATTYKVESGACRDEFGLLNKEIIDEIQSWNEDIVYKKVMQDNFWVGIFYADIYDTLETIDLEQMKK